MKPVARFRPRSLLAAAVLILGLLVLAAVPAAADTLPIVEKSIALHGGDILEHSVVELEICSRSGCTALEVETDGERYRHVASGEVGEVERRVEATNDSVTLWEDGEEVPIAADDEQRYRDWVSARVYFAFLPKRLEDSSVNLRDLGLVDWQGRSLHKVEATFDTGSSTAAADTYIYWFDPETARVEQFAYSFGSKGGLRFRPAFNYRQVEGVTFFDQKNYGVENPQITTGDIDPEIADGMELVSTVTLKNISVRPLKP
ncbi:MAG: DUF6503 family protein [Acidobacteriota bacterium]